MLSQGGPEKLISPSIRTGTTPVAAAAGRKFLLRFVSPQTKAAWLCFGLYILGRLQLIYV